MRRHEAPFKKGDEGPHIQALQIILMLFGVTVPAVIRGVFKVNTELGVKELQREWRLPETGIVDEQFIIELGLRGVDYYKVVKSTKPHAPYYLSKKPVLETGPGVPIKEKWLLSQNRRFKLYDGRIFVVIKAEDGAILVDGENLKPDQKARIRFNRKPFHGLIEEDLAPADTAA